MAAVTNYTASYIALSLYYFKLHQCYLHFKQFHSEWVNHDNQTTLSEALTTAVKECTVLSRSHLLSELGSLSKSVSDLNSKINDFISQEAGLRNHITDTAKALYSISCTLTPNTRQISR